MKKLLTTFLKDLKLSLNSLYVYMEFGIAIIFILIMLFVVPENFDHAQKYHLMINIDDPNHAMGLDQLLSGDIEDAFLHHSLESIHEAMKHDRNSIGLVLDTTAEGLNIELILQGFESDAMKALIKSNLEGGMLSQLPGYQSIVNPIILEADSIKLSDRENILPIYLTMNIALMGLFVIAAYIFLDKDEGVIKAYAVAPVSIWQYLASKVMMMSVMGLATSLMVCLAVVGFTINYAHLILLVLAFNAFGSTLGLLISSYFDAMMKAMGALYVTIMVMMLASLSYLMPSFNPVWIKWFPTYPMLFSFRELLLENGNTTYMYGTAFIFLALSLVLFLYATIRFKKTITV